MTVRILVCEIRDVRSKNKKNTAVKNHYMKPSDKRLATQVPNFSCTMPGMQKVNEQTKIIPVFFFINKNDSAPND